MVKKNVVTEGIDGFFAFISTGYATVDMIVRRLVMIAVLLAVVVMTGVSLSHSAATLYGASEVVLSKVTIQASEAAVVVEEAAEIIGDSSSEFIDQLEAAVVGDKVTSEATLTTGSDVPLPDGTLP